MNTKKTSHSENKKNTTEIPLADLQAVRESLRKEVNKSANWKSFSSGSFYYVR